MRSKRGSQKWKIGNSTRGFAKKQGRLCTLRDVKKHRPERQGGIEKRGKLRSVEKEKAGEKEKG